MLRVNEIAKELGVAPRTVRQWIKKGSLPGYHMGHIYLVEVEDYQVFKENMKVRKKDYAEN